MTSEPYPNLSLFVADFLTWNPKGDRHSMEHPFFSLSKRRNCQPRTYTSPDGKAQITVTPSKYGMPTIWDKDLLIYAATLIREEIVQGRMGRLNQAIKIDVWNYLESTARGDGMVQYREVAESVKRLRGCSFETNIETNGIRYEEGFNLLDNYRIATKTKTGKIASLEIKLCDWLYGAIYNAEQEMLSINRNYFRLTGGIERRLYELARKHCGRQPFWKVGVETLWEKSGSQGELKKFRHSIFKGQVDLGTLPDYRVVLKPEIDQVWFFSRNHKEPVAAILEATKLVD